MDTCMNLVLQLKSILMTEVIRNQPGVRPTNGQACSLKPNRSLKFQNPCRQVLMIEMFWLTHNPNNMVLDFCPCQHMRNNTSLEFIRILDILPIKCCHRFFDDKGIPVISHRHWKTWNVRFVFSINFQRYNDLPHSRRSWILATRFQLMECHGQTKQEPTFIFIISLTMEPITTQPQLHQIAPLKKPLKSWQPDGSLGLAHQMRWWPTQQLSSIANNSQTSCSNWM